MEYVSDSAWFLVWDNSCLWPEAGVEESLWSMTSVGPGFNTWS
jgi:hypothetical protein